MGGVTGGPGPLPASGVLSLQMASMKMFQVQFHTGFVPRNATTVKFAKCVGVPRGGSQGWAQAGSPEVVSRTVWGLWALDLVRKELRTRVQVPEQLHGACGVEEQGHGHGLGLGAAARLRVGLPGTSCPCSLAACLVGTPRSP